jgi:hypothetical protein
MHSPDGGEDSLTYVEKIDTEVEIGTCEERVEATTEIVSYEEKVETEEKTGKKLQDQVAKERILDASLPVVVEEKEVPAPKPNVTITLPKKNPIKLLSLMRPKVL